MLRLRKKNFCWKFVGWKNNIMMRIRTIQSFWKKTIENIKCFERLAPKVIGKKKMFFWKMEKKSKKIQKKNIDLRKLHCTSMRCIFLIKNMQRFKNSNPAVWKFACKFLCKLLAHIKRCSGSQNSRFAHFCTVQISHTHTMWVPL